MKRRYLVTFGYDTKYSCDISGVSGFLKKDAVKLYIRNASGDSCFEYAKRTKTRLNKWDMKKITTKNRPKK